MEKIFKVLLDLSDRVPPQQRVVARDHLHRLRRWVRPRLVRIPQFLRHSFAPQRIAADHGKIAELRCVEGMSPSRFKEEQTVVRHMEQRGAGVTEPARSREPDLVLGTGLAARPLPRWSAPERQDLG